ncbi:hypothetical protein HMPREF0091_10959 [Fannyhessea vaginae DSM 15829]|uniref:Uncharacterized protein n=1 Tax=Fannyhessea vaginae DSM 15829 TaxID=525256 RepID=F1T659_9ACTN|nr:hypothetical protein HMPREF0091_10959 [Fannyhessea vaginae DSM 15829]
MFHPACTPFIQTCVLARHCALLCIIAQVVINTCQLTQTIQP